MQVTLGSCANNGPKMKPVLIITRPAPDGERFARAVAAQVDVSIVMSPLQEIIPVEARCDADEFVFTSTNGVVQAARLGLASGRAWCVGDRTAQVARDAGFDAVSAGGNVEDLLALILQQHPTQELVHIRGREARGDIAPRLTAAGVICRDVVAYEQSPVALTDLAIAVIEGGNPAIIPLFSPRAAVLLLEQVKIGPMVTLIAMSEAVADRLGDQQVMVANAPNGDAMLAQVVEVCRKLQPS